MSDDKMQRSTLATRHCGMAGLQGGDGGLPGAPCQSLSSAV